MLNVQKGNMYGFVTHTWNAIKGKCQHDCSYCYMKVFPQKNVRLDEKEFNTDLGEGNVIFVGSSTDMFASNIPAEWIIKVLKHCNKFPKNTYLFQSKNPKRFHEFLKEKEFNKFPRDTILCTTLESNRDYFLLTTPKIQERIQALRDLDGWGIERMITIEPIMDFDLKEFVEAISYSHTKLINIGADSKNHKLPEPSKEKTLELIKEINKLGCKITEKENIKRIIK